MQRVMFFRREQVFDLLVSKLVADFVRQQANTTKDSENVGVHWEDGSFAGEEQHAGSGFWANTFQ